MEQSASHVPLVFVIILNWNCLENTLRCLQTLRAIDYKNYRTIVVDNASSIDPQAILKSQFPDVEYLQTGRNKGYGDGNNYGIMNALKKKAQYVWIVNPDLEPGKKTLTVLVEALEKDNGAGIVGPRLLWKTGESFYCVDGVEKKGAQFASRKFMSEWDDASLPRQEEVFGLVGCSLLIRSEVFETSGLFRDDFFLFHEEIEFMVRARKKSWKSILCREAVDRHLWEDTKSEAAAYLFPRNELFLARLHFPADIAAILGGYLNPRGLKCHFKKIGLPGVLKLFFALVSGLLKPLAAPPSVGKEISKK